MGKRKHLTAKQIKDIRDAAGLTQKEAAKLIGVSQGLWSDWERGNRRPAEPLRILLHQIADGKLKPERS